LSVSNYILLIVQL